MRRYLNENFFNVYAGTHNKINVIRDSVIEDSIQLPGRDLPTWSLMYIDDLNIGEVHAMERLKKSLFSQIKEQRTIHATHCEERFNTINEDAKNIGMRINAEKTQLCKRYTIL